MSKVLHWQEFEHIISPDQWEQLEEYLNVLVWEEVQKTGVDPFTGEKWKHRRIEDE